MWCSSFLLHDRLQGSWSRHQHAASREHPALMLLSAGRWLAQLGGLEGWVVWRLLATVSIIAFPHAVAAYFKFHFAGRHASPAGLSSYNRLAHKK